MNDASVWKWLVGMLGSILVTGAVAWFTFGGGVSQAEGQEIKAKASEHDRDIAVLKANLAAQQATLNEVKQNVKEGNAAAQGKLDAILLALPETVEPPPVVRKYDAKDVQLYTSPWVSGTRAAAYFGPVVASNSYDGSWNDTIESAIETIQDAASLLGANSIVGVEIAADPFAVPPTLTIIGTAAELVPLF